MEWVVEGEDILFQCRAIYKGRTGTMFATNKRLAWYQTSANFPQISLPLEMLKGAPKANKAASAKVMLKFVPKSPIKEQEEFLFELTSNARLADRDGVIEVMNQLLGKPQQLVPVSTAVPSTSPAGGKTADAAKPQQQSQQQQRESKGQRAIREAGEGLSGGDARRRAAALAGDVSLRLMFDELVSSGLISEEEFWHNRESDLEKYKVATAAQVVGPTAELVSELKPSLVRQGEIHYRLTPAVISQIFAEHPIVRRAYESNVPHKRTETEFWTEYLQSRYVEAASNKPRQAVAGDIFAKAEADLQSERGSVVGDIALDVDVRAAEGETCGQDDAEEPAVMQGSVGGINPAVESVIQRFNAHSALVVAAAAAGAVPRPLLEDDLMPHERTRAVGLELRDVPTGAMLAEEELLQGLLLLQHREDDDGGTRAMDQRPDGQDHVLSVSSQSAAAFAQAVLQTRTTPAGILFASSALPMSVLRGGAEQSTPAIAAAAAVGEPKESEGVTRAQELCRHFWACFPITSQGSVVKARRILGALQKLLPTNDEVVAGMIQRAVKHAAANGV